MTQETLFSGPRMIRVIDYETTGFPENEASEVIELGRCDLDLATMTIRNKWSAFARPSGPIPPETKAIHHITEADVEPCPRIGERWRPFWHDCGPDDVVAAHNAAFEQHFHSGNGRAWIDTWKCALVVWPDAPAHNNQVLRYWLDLDASPDFSPADAMPPHRALPDAYVTAHILRRLLDHRTVAQLVEISKWPALIGTIRFGKHKGEKMRDLPGDYLEWIRDKSDLDRDLKFTADYWLKKRVKGEA